MEFALRKKMMAIVDIVNSRTPFEIVKDLSLSSSLSIKVAATLARQLRDRINQQLVVLPPSRASGSLYAQHYSANNKISKIEGLMALPQLEWLSLKGNQIVVICGLLALK